MEMQQQQNMEISEAENLDNSSDLPPLRYNLFSKPTDKSKPMKPNKKEENLELEEEPCNSLKDLMLKKLHNLPGEPHKSPPITIYRVPTSFRETRKTFYEPKMVSIGPYYHGKEELQAMQEHKWWYVRDFISRYSEIPMETYVQEMRKIETQARLCYSEKVKLDKDEFAMMLLLDGCFILEYFLKYQEKEIDFLCDVGWGGPTIISDLLLLENQIPFFIIHKLACMSNSKNDCSKGCKLVSDIFSYLPYREMLTSPDISCDKIHHLLHLYYVTMMPKSQNKPLNHQTLKRALSWKWVRHPDKSRKNKKSLSVIIPCAAELHESGVKFKRNLSHCLFDIKFKKGVLEMPLLVVDNTIRIIVTNLVAFEQTQIHKTKIFTSYVILWNMLVDTSNDVSLLEKHGIVELVQHNEAQAADFFNDLAECWSMDYDDHYYAGLFFKLQKFCGSTWNKYRAGLMRDYFNNPWSSISVGAAIFLLIMTVIQTYYTVYPGGEESCRS